MAEKITINEEYLNNQLGVFTTYESDSYTLATGPLKNNVRMNTGGEAFQPGKDLKQSAEIVRTNFFTRVTQFNEQTSFLTTGIRSLLDNSERIESLNTVTAEDFTYYVEETASGGGASPTGSSGGEQ